MKKEKMKKLLVKIQKEPINILKNYNISFEGSICDTNSKFKDVISFYILYKNGKIKEISVKCGPCDPYAYIVSNILVKIIKGMQIDQIRIDNEKIYENFKKCIDEKIDNNIRFHYETILKMLYENFKNIKSDL